MEETMLKKIFKKIFNEEKNPYKTNDPLKSNSNIQLSNILLLNGKDYNNPQEGDIIIDFSTNQTKVFAHGNWSTLMPMSKEMLLQNENDKLKDEQKRIKMFLETKNISEDELKEFNDSIDVCEKLIKIKI